MNYTKLFYWLTVADNAKTFMVFIMALFTILFVLSMFCFFFGRDEYNLTCPKDGLAERAKKWAWWSAPFAILFWSLFILTPSKKDALLIIAGGQTLNYLTTNETAKKLPEEALNFVVAELKSMSADAKVELGIQSQKEKILEDVKKLSAQELIEKMKVDTTLAKIVLDK